jgi:thioredoxin reductase
VILLAHTTELTSGEREALHARGITIVDGTVEELVVTNDQLQGVRLVDGRTVARRALFIRPALRAHVNGPAAALGCELLEDGLVGVDAGGRTSVPGVWAAGNACNPRAQVITAAGEGSAVAIAINTELVEAEVDAALQQAAAATAA